MESAPLTLAHTHARNAVLETKRSNPVAASEEHDLAAAEFAAAAQATGDSEALRILTLLEQHHKKLGQILKSRHENHSGEGDASSSPPTSPTAIEKPVKMITLNAKAAEGGEAIPYPPRLARTSRPTARDLSSSIASNLASARGIPNTRHRRPEPISPSISAEHAGGRFSKEQLAGRTPGLVRQDSDRSVRENSSSHQQQGKPSWAPPGAVLEVSNTQEQEQQKSQSSSDAPFQQFYNTFESLISKLSAPLAFAGLPLTATQPTRADLPQAPNVKPKTIKVTTPTPTLDSSIDCSTLISRAALRAVRDGIPNTNPAESFYVVPTTGGTVSYAEIMTRAERESSRINPHHTRTLSGISEDDFFDAPQSNSAPDSPMFKSNAKRTTTLPPHTKTVNTKTMEELALENTALKHLSDTLSKRLHVFELSAQSSSAALAQSIRSLQLSPHTTPDTSRDKHHQPSNERVKELEETLRKSDREVSRRREENAKLKETVLRYREKWDKLKEGARARRADGGNGRGVDSPGIGAPVEAEEDDREEGPRGDK